MFDKDPETRACIEAFQTCEQLCLRTLPFVCNEISRPLQADLVRVILDCAEMCRLAANFLVRDSEHYIRVCREASEICGDLATHCEAVEGLGGLHSVCDECVAACRMLVC